MQDLLAEYKLQDPRALKEDHAGWPANRATQSASNRLLSEKALILSSLAFLGTCWRPSAPSMGQERLRRPSRSRRSPRSGSSWARTCLRGGLCLAPETINVAHKAEPPSDAAVEVTFEGGFAPQTRYFLTAPGESAGVAPFWFVQTTTDDQEANMHWQAFKVQTETAGRGFRGFGSIERPWRSGSA